MKETKSHHNGYDPHQGQSEQSNFLQRQSEQEEEEVLPFVSAKRLGVQPKLMIGAPNDPYEQEADRMADFVMRNPNNGTQSPVISSLNSGSLQRQCTTCEHNEEGIVQRKCATCEAEENNVLQRQGAGNPGQATTQFSDRLQNRNGQGTPLSPNVQQEMDGYFHADFSQVRVHTDSEANTMSQEIQAQAFTHGSDIYFNQGRYNPESTQGKRLLAHELTHVVQQNSGGVRNIQRTPLDVFNERFPGISNLLFRTISALQDYIVDTDYHNSNGRSTRTDIFRYRGISYNLGRINRDIQRELTRFNTYQNAIMDDQINGQFDEVRFTRMIRVLYNLSHKFRILAIAQGFYPLYGTRSIQFMTEQIALGSLSIIIENIRRLRRSDLYTQHIGEISRQEGNTIPIQRNPPTRRRLGMTGVINEVIRYYNENIVVRRGNFDDRVYAHTLAGLIHYHYRNNLRRYTEFFIRIRSERPHLYERILFENRLRIELYHLGVRGLDEFFNPEGFQFARHVIFGSCNFDSETGRENDAPGVALILDVILGIIPYVGQALDARDIVCYIYRMGKYESERNSFWTRLGLAGSIIGVIPAIGDAIKSILKPLRRATLGIPSHRISDNIVRFLTRFVSLGTMMRYARRLNRYANRVRALPARGLRLFNRIMRNQRLRSFITSITDLPVRLFNLLRSVMPESLRGILRNISSWIQELMQSLTLLGRVASIRTIEDIAHFITRNRNRVRIFGRNFMELWNPTARFLSRLTPEERAAVDILRRVNFATLSARGADELAALIRRTLNPEDVVSDVPSRGVRATTQLAEEASEETGRILRPGPQRLSMETQGGARSVGIRGTRFKFCRNPCSDLLEQIDATREALPIGHRARFRLRRLYRRVARTQSQFERGIISEETARRRLSGYIRRGRRRRRRGYLDELEQIQDQYSAVDYILSHDAPIIRSRRDQFRDIILDAERRGDILDEFGDIGSPNPLGEGAPVIDHLPGRIGANTEAGLFVHTGRYAEALSQSQVGYPRFLPRGFSADFVEGNIIMLHEMPVDLLREVRLGVLSRVDRMRRVYVQDSVRRIIYEIKPNTAQSINAGFEQIDRYVGLANRTQLDGFSDWRGIIVLYDQEAAQRLIGR